LPLSVITQLCTGSAQEIACHLSLMRRLELHKGNLSKNKHLQVRLLWTKVWDRVSDKIGKLLSSPLRSSYT